jgi:transposase
MGAWMVDGGICEDREQFWWDHVAGWKSSGLSLRLYSEEHRLKAGTLGYWNSWLKARTAEAPAPSPGPDAGATFLAVHVVGPAVTVPEPRDDWIELALPGRCIFRVSRGFDAATLERLLDVVERRS